MSSSPSAYRLYQDIATRTGGEVYIGVVGPVRTGKSTFIKRFMETLVLPHMEEDYSRSRTRDEMPVSAAGKTVMTTEPKFIPDEAATVTLTDADGTEARLRVRMIDCVGYIVPGAAGHTEDGRPRMVMTPWSESEMPFEEAAEIGTQKVIREHSTIGCLVTSDGTIGEIPRESYEIAEKRVADELREIGKPFVIVLNSADPSNEKTIALALSLEDRYRAHVALVNCLELTKEDIENILSLALLEFPIHEIAVTLPAWVESLDDEQPMKKALTGSILSRADGIKTVGDARTAYADLSDPVYGTRVSVSGIDLACGKLSLTAEVPEKQFFTVLGENTGFVIDGKDALMQVMTDLADVKRQYDKISSALRQVNETGYGIVTPSLEELSLEEPEIVKQAGGYGVRLRASAPSIHMIRADIKTEVSPIVGSEKQSDDMVRFLLKEFEEDPKKIWETDMFGKSLHELINEGLNAKLAHMPAEARQKIASTLGRIINEGADGLICIIL